MSTSLIPEYKIKYKNESLLMQVIGRILFFNKNFMTKYLTTFGSTIYAPSKSYFKNNPITSQVNLMHEIVHVKDFNKNKIWFLLSYLFPQILGLIGLICSIGLFHFYPWILIPISLFFLLPLPAYFRMQWEKKAYSLALYAYASLEKKYGYTFEYSNFINSYRSKFLSSDYYYTWIFFDKDYFNKFLDDVKHGGQPIYDKYYFDMIDKLVELAHNNQLINDI